MTRFGSEDLQSQGQVKVAWDHRYRKRHFRADAAITAITAGLLVFRLLPFLIAVGPGRKNTNAPPSSVCKRNRFNASEVGDKIDLLAVRTTAAKHLHDQNTRRKTERQGDVRPHIGSLPCRYMQTVCRRINICVQNFHRWRQSKQETCQPNGFERFPGVRRQIVKRIV